MAQDNEKFASAARLSSTPRSFELSFSAPRAFFPKISRLANLYPSQSPPPFPCRYSYENRSDVSRISPVPINSFEHSRHLAHLRYLLYISGYKRSDTTFIRHVHFPLSFSLSVSLARACTYVLAEKISSRRELNVKQHKMQHYRATCSTCTRAVDKITLARGESHD